MSSKILLAAAFVATLSMTQAAFAQGTAFTYQGRLDTGPLPATGSFDLRILLFDSGVPAVPPVAALGSNTRLGVPVTNGLFTVMLDFGARAFDGPGRWLEFGVRSNSAESYVTLTPRQPVSAVPYAITAGNLSGLLPSAGLAGSYSGAVMLTNPANQFFGDGTGLRFGGAFDYCTLPCYWNLRGNAGTTPGLNFVGTTDNKALELRVFAQRAFRLEPTTNAPNLIGGFGGNGVENNLVGVTIGGGGTVGAANFVRMASDRSGFATNTAHFATIAGGAANGIAGSSYSSIGGGLHNEILQSAPFVVNNLDFDTISGGMSNRIDFSRGSSVAGGTFNSILGMDNNWVYNSTIGGGSGNSIETFIDNVSEMTIAGGKGNRIIRSDQATVGGGLANSISVDSYYSTVAGGRNNQVGSVSPDNTISGGAGNHIAGHIRGATIAGGSGNRVGDDLLDRPGDYAFIGGGQTNAVTGPYGTVSGGVNNSATNRAFAAGTQAKALHNGSFVWAAGNTADYPSSADNRAQFYAPGGFLIGYAGQAPDGQAAKFVMLASTTPGRVINVFNGAYLSEGGVWTDNSDRNSKENFEPVDSREILEQVAALPLSRWNYRSESNSVRHLGPVAQDFHQAFGLGPDDKHIAGLDSGGVALAAIQGLNQKLQEKQAAIERLQQRLDALEASMKK